METLAVHPDHQHAGIGRALLGQALGRIRTKPAVTTLDAWTRDDPDTLRWYRAMGFSESDHYLHVYASHYAVAGEPERAVVSTRPDLYPVTAFLHGKLADEERLRGEFARVHVCRRFSMTL